MYAYRAFLLTSAAQQTQKILGLPWWVWVIALIIVAILLYLLTRNPAAEVKPFIEEKTSPPVEPKAAQPAPFTADIDSLDDLTIIEGIGPKISGILREAGLNTFQKLSETPPHRIAEILKAAGINLFDASTWPEQAALISEGKWVELKALQDKLIAGRRE